MKTRNSYYLSRKNLWTWLSAIVLIASAGIRIVTFGEKGTETAPDFWGLCVLPTVASLLYVVMILLNGKEQFYRTAIPVWMISLYFYLRVDTYPLGIMISALFFFCLFSFSVIYQWITCGKVASPVALIPVYLSVAATAFYLNQHLTSNRNWPSYMIADFLMLSGLFLVIFALRLHPANEYHPTWGDRIDGRRIRTREPMAQVEPYFMVTRNGCTNQYADSFEITAAERYIRQKRKEGLTNFGLTHVLLACYIRGLAKYPGLNRFIAGQKLYTHGDDIIFCMVVKKEMSALSPDTVIKVHFSPKDTAEDVYRKMNAAVEEVKSAPLDSTFDSVAHIFTMIPGLFLKFVMWLLKSMDYLGLMPRFILEVSPFHGSIFFTSMGSLGIPPVFHHLYDFGNLPVFCSFGCKRRANEVTSDGEVVSRKYIDFTFSMDDRIVDGFYYASFLKYYKRVFAHPEQLDLLPEEIATDIA